MPKSHDARKEKMKAPQRTLEEKRQAKRDKKNKVAANAAVFPGMTPQ
jgi:hypothetical protein